MLFVFGKFLYDSTFPDSSSAFQKSGRPACGKLFPLQQFVINFTLKYHDRTPLVFRGNLFYYANVRMIYMDHENRKCFILLYHENQKCFILILNSQSYAFPNFSQSAAAG